MTTANLTITDNDTVIQYTSVGESAFIFPFPILASDELDVSVDQVDQVLGVDYTIAGIGDAGGGTVTFVSPTTIGELITLWLDMPIKRLTGFNTGAAVLLGEDMNTEFVRQVRQDQMIRRDVRRALRIDVDDPLSGQDMVIPTQTTRAGKFLTFDAGGKPSVTDANVGADTALRSDLASQTAAKGFNLVAITPVSGEVGITQPQFRVGDIQRYFVSGNFALQLENAINSASATGRPVIIDDDYSLAATVTITALTGPLTVRGFGKITYTGAATNYMILVSSTAGFDVDIDEVTLDCATLASIAWRFNNDAGSMASSGIGRLRFAATSLNCYMKTGNTQGATGLLVAGGFSTVTLDGFLVRNVSRDTGAGTPGSQGCSGILITFVDIDAYVQRVIVRGGEIDTVTNNETTGTGDDVDVDGIIFAAPAAGLNSNLHLAASFHLSGGTRFKDCKGRCVKTQLDGFTICTDWIIERSLEEAINNAVDFDLQRGGGIVKDGVYYVNETGGAATPWGTSHAIVQVGFDQAATAAPNQDGGLNISDIVMYNSVGLGTDTLPFFAIVNNDDVTKELIAVSIRDISIMGGRLARVLQTNIGNAPDSRISIEGVQADITTSLIHFTANVNGGAFIQASKNKNTGSSTPVLLELNNDTEPMLSGYDNDGFISNLLPASVASSVAEVFRPKLLGGDTPGGHVMSQPQSVTLADDGTHAFEPTGVVGIWIITSTWAQTGQIILAHDNNSIVEFQQGGGANGDLSIGPTTNPDTAGDLNVWITGNNTLNIKNRLGSQRTFHMWHFGG